MKVEKEVKKSLSFDPEKAEALYDELVKVFKKHKPTVGEILIVFGNLGYTLGASIEGYKGKGPTMDELNKLYYSNPTAGVALMIEGLNITQWYEDYEKTLLAQNGNNLQSDKPKE